MKTELVTGSLVDTLVVCKGLPADEIEQIEAFSGDKLDIQDLSMKLIQSSHLTWTIRVKETREPVAVAGLFQVGTNIWRTWFLANQRAWDEFGKEVTFHVASTRKKLLKGQQHMRIETICLAKRKRAREWYETCGMEYESTMRAYGVNGESAVMYISTVGEED